MLTAILLISANILNINFLYAYADENNKSVARDVVLVIDTSYSMEGQPIEAVKTASKQFCDDLLDSTDDNKVAIVLYAGNVYSKKEFTNNLSELHSYIDSIGLRSATNIYDALVSAKELLDNHTGREDAIKNIILLTDGLPHHSPPAEDDRYADLQSEGTGKNATYIYNYYTENLKNNYNVYTLGFYHKLNETLRPFANKFMSDIQNNGYYEVKDATKIRFAFKDIVKKINNSKCPVIVVPGIMGSRLFKGEKLVWIPKGMFNSLKAISKYSKNMVISQKLSVRGNYDENGKPVNQALLPESKREYGAYDSSKLLIDGIIGRFSELGIPRRSVYIFSYDFRKSNSENSEKLNKFINDVLKANPNYSQVDVVAHSMGGLVLSSYVNANGSDKLRRIITAATPYEGATRMIQSTLTSKVTDNIGGNFALKYLGGFSQDIKTSYPSIAQLMPTKRYFNSTVNSTGNVSSLFKTYKDEGFIAKPTLVVGMTYDDYYNINKKLFKNLYDEAVGFHNSIIRNNTNILATLDKSYFVIGTGEKTVTGLTYDENGITNLTYDNGGDGTVPLSSENMIGYLDNLPSGRTAAFQTNHTGVIGFNPSEGTEAASRNSVNWIIDILAKGSSDIAIPKYDPTRFIVIRVACPVDAEISKDGKVLSSNEEVFNDSTSFGCMDLCGKDGEIKMFCIDDAADYNIKLKGTDTGRMDYSIRYFNEDATLDKEFNFTNVPITDTTVITTKSDINDIKLSLDSDNDGNTDYTLAPQDYSELKLPESPRKDLLEPGYTLNMGNGGLISSITRDGREIEIASTEEAPVNEGDKAEITAPEYKSGFKFKYWDLAYGDINLNRNERTQVITVNKSDIRLNAVYEETPLASDSNASKAGIVYESKSGNFAINVWGEENSDYTDLKTALISNEEDRAVLEEGKELKYSVVFNEAVPTASDSNAIKSVEGEYVKAALKLDIGLKRYVNNIFSPLASNTTPKVHVYAKLPNKMLGKSEYKLWKLEKDENSTDTVLTEIDTSHTKLNTPYFTGSFDFTSDIGSKILISYKDTNRVAIVSALPGEKYSQAKVNVLNVISGQTLENNPEYNMLALDIDKIYTEPATGIVYNFAGLSKDKEGHKKIGTDVPIKEQMILYTVYEPAKTDNRGSDNTPRGNINDMPDNTSDNHDDNKNYSKDKKTGDSKSDGVYSSSSSTNSLSKIIYAHKSAAETEGGKWISLDNDRKKWAFELKDKSRIKRAWAEIKDASGAVNTYCFDEKGVMQIGWITHEGGIWYFLEAQDERMLGSLKKGWYHDNNDKYWYYLNPQTGVMEKGWQMINNKWYYFSEIQRNLKYNNETGENEYYPQRPYGSMYINEKTPDNYNIGNDGNLIGN